jgi:hypothetical protein
VAPMTEIRDSVVHSKAITASSTSGFTVTISPSAPSSWTLIFWAFRV